MAITRIRPARRNVIYLLLAAGTVALAGPRLWAQTYQQVAPQPVPEPASAKSPAPAAPVPVRDPNEVLVPQLTGLRLVAAVAEISRSALPAGQPLSIENLPWLDRTRTEALANGYLGRPLTRGGLARLTQSLVLLARASNRPVVDVYAPPQEVSAGVLQLVVMVAKLGQARVENNRWFSSALLLRYLRLQPGQDIVGRPLLEDINLIDQNPFRQANLIYARGGQPGTTDVILDVHDIRPERAYAGYSDTGNEATGLGRVFAGFNLGDLFDEDQQLNYQYTRGTDGSGLQAHSGSYVVPLPWRDTLDLFGSWARAESEARDLFQLTGITWQMGARYTIPLPMLRTYTQSLVLGADYKWSNNNLAFGGEQVFAAPASIAQATVGYTGTWADAAGSTQVSVTAFISPGGLGGQNHDTEFAAQRAGATANYQYYQLSLERIEKLPGEFTAVLTTLGQWSPDRLLPSEQFGLGGATSVRGYDERLFNGDDGFSGQLELRTPSRHFLGRVPDQSQALVFVDFGREWQHDPQPGEVDTTLVSAGPGLRMAVGRYVSIRADYGWDLKPIPGDRRGRIHLSAVMSY